MKYFLIDSSNGVTETDEREFNIIKREQQKLYGKAYFLENEILKTKTLLPIGVLVKQINLSFKPNQ